MPKILAIDDINDNLISLKAIISDAFPGAVVFTALNGPTGIELAIACNPDVILLDVIMPGMDGFEVCRQLKQDERVSDIPVVFLTAIKGDKESRIKALEVGAEGFLTKPIDETELIAQIRAMVKIKVANEQKRNEKDLLETLVAERTRELENSQAQLKGIFENLQDAYFQADLSGRFTIISPSAVAIYGFESIDEIIGQPAELLYFDLQDRNKMLSVLHSAGRVKDFVCQARKKDGSPFWASMNVQLIYGSDGQILGTEGVARDISKRKQAEEELKVSKEDFRQIVERSNEIFYRQNLVTGQFEYVSPKTYDILGYTTDEFLAQDFNQQCEAIHPEDLPRLINFANELVEADHQNQKFITREFRIKNKKGEYIWVRGNYILIRDEENNPAKVIGSLNDITERKLAVEALQESEVRFREFFEKAADAIFIADIDTGIILDVNEAATRLTWKNYDQMVGIHQSQLHLPAKDDYSKDTFKRHKELIKQNLMSYALENTVVRADGTEVPVEILASEVNYHGKQCMMGTFRDITERKKSEKAIQESEAKYRYMFQHNPQPMWIYDHDTLEILEVNKVSTKIYGYSREEFLSMTIKEIHPAEDIPLMLEDVEESRLEENSLGEWRHLKKSGEIMNVEISVSSVIFNGRKSRHVLIKDITERTEAEKALRESEEKYRRMVDLLPDAIIIHTEGKVAFANAATHKIIGLSSPDQLIGKSILDFVHPDSKEPIIKRIKEIYETGEPSGFAEEKFTTFDNKVIDAEVIGIPVSYKGKPAIQTILRDITERKRAEEALWESQLNFKALFEKGPIGVAYHQMIYDETGKPIDYLFLDANQSYQKLTGVNPVGKLVTKAFPGIEKDSFDWIGTFGEVAKTGKEIRFQQYLQTNNRWYDCVGYQYKPDHFVAAFFEITEKKLAEEKMSSIFRVAPTGIGFVVDRVIMEVNPRITEMTGFAKDELIGQSSRILYPTTEEFVYVGQEKYAQISEKGTGVLETRWQKKDGSVIHILLSSTPINRSDISKGVIFTALDITKRKQAEIALQESEERYRRFISQVSEGVYRFESDEPMDTSLPIDVQVDFMYDHLTIAECNNAFLKMYGFTNQKEMIGKTMIDLHGGRNNKSNRDVLRTFVENNYHVEETVTEELNSQGQKIYISNTSIGILENNKLVRIWGTQSDISSRIKDSQVQQVLYSISNAALSSIDLSELIEFISKEIGKLLDSTNFYIAFYDEETNMLSTLYERDEKDVLDSWPAEKSITGYVIRHQKSMRITYEDVKKLSDTGEIEIFGTPSEVWLGVPLVMNKKVIGALVVQSYDDPEAYTEQDKLMLEFISHQISISIERKKAEQELNAALIKAQESDRLKSSFLANMSHEIRTPLNSIIGFSELMCDPDFDLSQHLDFSRMINSSGNNLLTIITDIMDLSKIEAGQVVVRKEPVSVNELIRDIHKEYSFMAGKKGIRLEIDLSEIDEQVEIESDESALRKILINFVGNAIKFTKEGFIEIGVRPVGKYLQFHVKDTGIGIPSEFHKTIFERFRQIESFSTRKYGGNGLGLAISKSLVELLGGKIWMESESGVGSTFFFAVPIEEINY